MYNKTEYIITSENRWEGSEEAHKNDWRERHRPTRKDHIA